MKLAVLALAAIALTPIRVSVAAELPRKALNVQIALPDGKKIDIEQFRGSVLCVAFINTT